MLKILKWLYFTLVFIIFSLAMYVFITGDNPIYKIDDVYKEQRIERIQDTRIVFSKNDKTLITKEANISILGTEKIDSYNFTSDENRKNLVIEYKITAKQDLKPNVFFGEYIKVEQDGHELSDGGISADVGTERFEQASNNSVKKLKAGESVTANKIINFDINGGPITIKNDKTLILEVK